MTCNLCGRADTARVLRLPALPVHANVLFATYEDARRAPMGEIDLHWCPICLHIFNACFVADKLEYGRHYDASLFHSAHYRAYAEESAKRLVDRYRLADKFVVEIGCGQGEFLSLLSSMAAIRGVGYDPGLDREQSAPLPGITLEKRAFKASHLDPAADLVVCRHVLEHLAMPATLLREIAAALAARTEAALFFEVPNGLYIFRDLGIWDIIYEHCSYFTPQSLRRAFEAAGFVLSGPVEQHFGGQFLCVEASLAGETSPHIEDNGPEPGQWLQTFASRFERKIENWRQRLRADKGHGVRTAIWGAGSKGVSFLNLMAETGAVDDAVDINPKKHGRFTPGTGLRVVSPEHLRQVPPDQVLVMNPNYRNEIGAQLESLGLSPRLVDV